VETTLSRAEPAWQLSVEVPRRVMAEDVGASGVLRAQPMLEDPAGDVNQSQEIGQGEQEGTSNKDGMKIMTLDGGTHPFSPSPS
jgi:hypothetical protein